MPTVPVTPLPSTVKFAAATPVTDSLKVTVKFTVVALVGFASARTIEETSGASVSTSYTSPVKLPLPNPVPPTGRLPMSTTVSSSTKFRPSVPSPMPVFTVTTRVLPVSALTPAIDAPVRPVTARAKSAVPTPVTGSLKVTWNWTVAALVGFGSRRTIDVTVGIGLTPTPATRLFAVGRVHDSVAFRSPTPENSDASGNTWMLSSPVLFRTTYMLVPSRNAP